MLPKQAINEFRQIYQKIFRETLSADEAQKKAENFIGLFALITNQPVKPHD